jgi:uncharacterized protein YbjQ (UPF0145 family)
VRADNPDAGRGAGNAWGSLLSVREFAALSGAGFEPVGAVLGTAVFQVGYVNRAGKCSGSVSSRRTLRTDLASASTGPFNLLLRKAQGMRRLALTRALEECAELGGDGIAGITMSVRPFPAGGTEFSVQGTAVRARGAIHPAAPFTSHVPVQDLVNLMQEGWAPVTMVFGVALGARHDDMRTRSETKRLAGNREVRGYTDLVQDTRRDAREQLKRAVEQHAGEGVVVGDMTLGISERECPALDGQHDHVAEATILGTAIVSFGRPPASRDSGTLTMMRLNPPSAEPVPAGSETPAGSAAVLSGSAPEGGFLDRHVSGWATKHVSGSSVSLSESASWKKRQDQYEL